jgi:hypothetical protein
MTRKFSQKLTRLAQNPVRRTLLFDNTRGHKIA